MRGLFIRIRPGNEFPLGGFKISTIQLNHPGITLGYRIEHDGAALVIFTDTARIKEVQLGDQMAEAIESEGLEYFQEQYSQRVLNFVQGADMLIHDTHFLEDEIIGKEHWGHSTSLDALELARKAGVRQLMLFHHAPEHVDDTVDKKLAFAREQAKDSPLRVSAAREGMAIEILGGAPC